MKNKIILTTLILTAFIFFPKEVYASECQSISYEDRIHPCADTIVVKYREYNHKLQYRRWNSTKGFWVDKTWIDT